LAERGRTSGQPPSANGASSLHAWWECPGPLREVAVTLEVLVPPSVPWLHFWALQVSVVEAGRRTGGGHLGLQAAPWHPGGTAVNWGGYAEAGRELDGTASPLPSAAGNVNTRDFAWRPRRPYRLRVAPGSEAGHWRGEVTDVRSGEVTVVRELRCPGSALADPVVWSEVFAPCDAPGTAVRWSDPVVVTTGAAVLVPPAVRTTYQSVADGGCSNTATFVDRGAVVQATATERRVPHGTRLPLDPEDDGSFPARRVP
jgi:hypothetical protein